MPHDRKHSLENAILWLESLFWTGGMTNLESKADGKCSMRCGKASLAKIFTILRGLFDLRADTPLSTISLSQHTARYIYNLNIIGKILVSWQVPFCFTNCLRSSKVLALLCFLTACRNDFPASGHRGE